MTGLALFDLDGTLLPLPSAERRFLRWLLRRGRLGPYQFSAAAGFALARVPQYGGQVWKKNKAYLAGLRVADVAQWGATFARDELVPRLRSSLTRRVAEHARAGDRCVLLTGAPDFLAQPLARELGMDECIATRCAQRDGRYLAAPAALHPFGEEKPRLARALCAQIGIALADATAYADSRDDLALLLAVGRAVPVTPDADLAAVARRRGWLQAATD